MKSPGVNEMTAKDELKKEIYEGLLEGFTVIGPNAKAMSWFWKSHFKRSQVEVESMSKAA